MGWGRVFVGKRPVQPVYGGVVGKWVGGCGVVALGGEWRFLLTVEDVAVCGLWSCGEVGMGVEVRRGEVRALGWCLCTSCEPSDCTPRGSELCIVVASLCPGMSPGQVRVEQDSSVDMIVLLEFREMKVEDRCL